MQSQGWIPGSTLGATSANSNNDAGFSYMGIKRMEGKHGVGSSPQGLYDDSHHLDAFQEILGRLNGRPEVKCAAAITKSRDLQTVNYVESRWRVLKFVSGGLLTQDKSKDVSKQHQKPSSSPITQTITTCDVSAHEPDTRLDGLDRQDSMKSESLGICESREPDQTVMSRSANSASSESHDKRRKLETREPKKSKKRKRDIDNAPDLEQSQQPLSKEEAPAKPLVAVVESQTAPVVRSSLSSRHAVRMRYIRQKRMVMKDRKALNEVCPIFCVSNRILLIFVAPLI